MLWIASKLALLIAQSREVDILLEHEDDTVTLGVIPWIGVSVAGEGALWVPVEGLLVLHAALLKVLALESKNPFS